MSLQRTDAVVSMTTPECREAREAAVLSGRKSFEG